MKKNYSSIFHDNRRYAIVDLLLDDVLDKHVQKHDNTLHRKSSVLDGAYETEIFFRDLGRDGKWLFGTAALLKDENRGATGAIATW